MARKKETQLQESTDLTETAVMADEETQQNVETAPAVIVEDNGEKLENLKSLNARLLKQTVENRKEIGRLLESKKSLEDELTRSESEVESVKGELTRLGEGKDGLEKELMEVVKERDDIAKTKCGLESEVVALKKVEMDLKDEVKREKEGLIEANGERDELRREVERKDDEVNVLKGKLIELEGKERNAVDESSRFREEIDLVSKRLEESDKNLEGFRKECESLRKKIEESNGEKEMAIEENEGLRRRKEECEGRIRQLDEDVTGLNARVSSLREGEEKWKAKFFKLEASNGEVVQELEALKGDLSTLLEEKKAKEMEIERSIGEKKLILEGLGALEKEIEGLRRVHEEGSVEKSRLEKVISRQESEIKKLQGDLTEVLTDLLLLQEQKRDHQLKDMKLTSEIDEYKIELNRVKVERDNVKRILDEEKSKGAILRVQVSEISQRMVETTKVINELRTVSDTLVAEKKELESKYGSLVAEKSLAEKNFADAKAEIDELKGSLALKSEMFGYALTMLRKTALELAVENGNTADDEGVMVKKRSISGGDMEPYLAELESIKAVFKSRYENVGEMQQEMANLQCSVLDANKKKHFWTLVSSATTVVAALVSFAYAAKLR